MSDLINNVQGISHQYLSFLLSHSDDSLFFVIMKATVWLWILYVALKLFVSYTEKAGYHGYFFARLLPLKDGWAMKVGAGRDLFLYLAYMCSLLYVAVSVGMMWWQGDINANALIANQAFICGVICLTIVLLRAFKFRKTEGYRYDSH